MPGSGIDCFVVVPDSDAGAAAAERGLVDPEALAAMCAQTDYPGLSDGSLMTTVGCELWLRAYGRSLPAHF